jgi:hypothetical protein
MTPRLMIHTDAASLCADAIDGAVLLTILRGRLDIQVALNADDIARLRRWLNTEAWERVERLEAAE